jgi:hypothetical protein
MSLPKDEPPPLPPGNREVQPPPLPIRPPQKVPWVGILSAFLALAGAAAVYLYVNQPKGSTDNDEVGSPGRQVEDYKAWRDQLVQVVTTPKSQGALNFTSDPEATIGWWDRNFKLPNEKAARAALKRRLPEGFKLVSLYPAKVETTEDGTRVDYIVKLKAASTFYAVGLAPLVADPKTPARARELFALLKPAADLPAGKAYQLETKNEILAQGQTVTVPWAVRQVIKEEGLWKVLDAEPLYFQANPAFETKLIETQGSTVRLLRSTDALEEAAAEQEKTTFSFNERIALIQAEVEEFKKERLAQLPSSARMSAEKFGGSGSGEPTKSAARIGGSAAAGAAAGAGFGAIGGDAGLGAGVGAGAGLLGGLIYDLVSKEGDKKKLEAAKKADYQRQLNARSGAVAAMNREVALFEKQSYDRYEQELRARAASRN